MGRATWRCDLNDGSLDRIAHSATTRTRSTAVTLGAVFADGPAPITAQSDGIVFIVALRLRRPAVGFDENDNTREATSWNVFAGRHIVVSWCLLVASSVQAVLHRFPATVRRRRKCHMCSGLRTVRVSKQATVVYCGGWHVPVAVAERGDVCYAVVVSPFTAYIGRKCHGELCEYFETHDPRPFEICPAIFGLIVWPFGMGLCSKQYKLQHCSLL